MRRRNTNESLSKSFELSLLLEEFESLALARVDGVAERAAALDAASRLLGHQSSADMRVSLTESPPHSEQTRELLRWICFTRLPTIDVEWFAFELDEDAQSYLYQSQWYGYGDNGEELRIAAPVDGLRFVSRMREIGGEDVAVIQTEWEFGLWYVEWRGQAILPGRFAREHFLGAFERSPTRRMSRN